MRILLLNQTFHPDVMATGQYLTEVALGLVERGHEVTVVTSQRAYDDPAKLFPKRETWRGIRIIRVSSTAFGKGGKWRRAVDFGSFLVNCAFRLLFLSRPDVVVALTSPPLISVLGAGLARLKGSRFVYWVMDFNPDEAIAAGWLDPNSFTARVLERLSRFSLRRAARIIALDRFMRNRIAAKGIPQDKIVLVPPWSQDADVKFDPAGRGAFRREHGLDGKFVVMYSGNHSPCHPSETLLAAAEQMAGDPGVVFCFIGGGSEWRKIADQCGVGNAEWGMRNLLCLPYQPLSELSGSLSAADLHVVVMGDPFVGLVHPCKIYNILGVGAPVLCIGPRASHLSDLAESVDGARWYPAAHGEVDRVVQSIQSERRRAAMAAAQGERRSPGNHAQTKKALLPRLIAVLEEQGGG